jgi:sulfur-oxidizing protein SoxY
MSNVAIEQPDRRTFVLGASAMAAFAGFLATPALAQDAAALDAMMKKFIGDAKPVAGKVSIDLPEIAENGNTVPYSITVESPMSDNIASYDFTPESGKAFVSSRMRLGKTQDVYALAQMSDGKVFMAKKTVKVTIGGCGG